MIYIPVQREDREIGDSIWIQVAIEGKARQGWLAPPSQPIRARFNRPIEIYHERD
jgi:hypothetical protein